MVPMTSPPQCGQAGNGRPLVPQWNSRQIPSDEFRFLLVLKVLLAVNILMLCVDHPDLLMRLTGPVAGNVAVAPGGVDTETVKCFESDIADRASGVHDRAAVLPRSDRT